MLVCVSMFVWVGARVAVSECMCGCVPVWPWVRGCLCGRECVLCACVPFSHLLLRYGIFLVGGKLPMCQLGLSVVISDQYSIRRLLTIFYYICRWVPVSGGRRRADWMADGVDNFLCTLRVEILRMYVCIWRRAGARSCIIWCMYVCCVFSMFCHALLLLL